MKHSAALLALQNSTRVAFFIPGLAAAVWAPLIPYAKNRGGFDDATLGLLLLCLGVGSLLAMPLTGILVASQGCRRTMCVATSLMVVTLPLLAVVSSPLALGGALFVFGSGMGAMDCAMNIQAVAVERDSGQVMMSGFHAFYSIGGLAGAAIMTVLLSVGLRPLVATGIAAAFIASLTTFASGHWREARALQRFRVVAWPRGIVLVIGVLTFVVFLAEGAILDWSAVFLSDLRHVAPSRAGSGFMAFSLAMTITRLVGDRLVEYIGRSRAIVIGASCACAGFLVATQVPSWEAALVGFALVGIGCANIVPALFSMAGQQDAMPESAAIAAITTLGYTGILAGPGLIGVIARASSLGVAFLCVTVALTGVAICARWLKG